MAVLCLAVLALLSGCASAGKDALEAPPPSDIAMSEPHLVGLTLFYYPDSGERRTVYRRATREKGQSRAALVVESLLAETWKDETPPGDWRPVFEGQESGMELQSIELSGNTANVNLASADGASVPPRDQRIKCRVPLANSLIETLGVQYVNIYFNGEAMDDDGRPLGAMAWFEGSPDEYYEQLIAGRDLPVSTVNATLYFPDTSGNYLVMETRPLELSNLRGGEIVQALLEGPSTEGLMPIVKNTGEDIQGRIRISADNPGGYDEKETDDALPETSAGDQSQTEGEPQAPLNIKRVEIPLPKTDTDLAEAAVICSIHGLFRDVAGVAVVFDSSASLSQSQSHVRSQYQDKIGQLVTPAAATAGDGLLHRVRMAVPQARAEDPDEMLLALFAASDTADQLLFDAAWQAGALRSAVLSGSMAIVDLSSERVQAWQGLPPEALRLQLYAMVNSVTSIHGVHSVQILVDGERAQQIGGLMLGQPLLANPALMADGA